MVKYCDFSLPALTALIGALLLASNYSYIDGYGVQSWWPIILVIAGVCKFYKHYYRQANDYPNKSSGKLG